MPTDKASTVVKNSERQSLWWIFIFSVAFIPLLIKYDGRQVSADDLITIDNLILSKDVYHHKGYGRTDPTAYRLNVTATERTLLITGKEYNCLTTKANIGQLKRGDTITVRINKVHLDRFYSLNGYSKYEIIYSLEKAGYEYISLECRNKLATRVSYMLVPANVSSAVKNQWLKETLYWLLDLFGQPY